MNAPVTLPLWIVVCLVAASAWTLLVLLLAPGMRWFFRRRINAVIRQVGASLQVELPSFKLTRRQVLIDRLFHDERVQAAAAHQARAGGLSKEESWRRLDRYAREIVPSFNAYLYFRIGYALARSVARALYRVRIGYLDQEALARVDPKVFPHSHVAFIDCALGKFVTPAGWIFDGPGAAAPKDHIRFEEFHSTDLTGQPLDVSRRVAGSRQLTPAEAAQQRDLAFVLGGADHWNPRYSP